MAELRAGGQGGQGGRERGNPSSASSALFSSALLASASLASAQTPPIQDNSFLIEEAYNQEAHVVQHISNFARSSGGDWIYTFTQEWPLGGQRHQLSYTVPVIHNDGTGLGDIFLNYRLQAVGSGDTPLAVSPRLSLIVPSGSPDRGRGAGGVGVQFNLPASVELGRHFVTHLNAGATLFPSAQDQAGASATTTLFNLGGSLIWLAHPRLNLMLEALWLGNDDVMGDGTTDRSSAAFLNPGLRAAIDWSGVQIVPGVAYTIGIGPSDGDRALFLYLSLEHAF